jgi:prepilin-type N-terminal cleavage/methylation domain-containing protein
MNEKRKNKGFTLVELIVVLVILAILAAILVPALLGYIDRAKKQQIVLNAKSCLTAAQAEFSEMYARDEKLVHPTGDDGHVFGLQEDDTAETIMNVADVPDCKVLVVGCKGLMVPGTRSGYKISFVYYKEGNDAIYFDGTSWQDTDVENVLDLRPADTELYVIYNEPVFNYN